MVLKEPFDKTKITSESSWQERIEYHPVYGDITDETYWDLLAETIKPNVILFRFNWTSSKIQIDFLRKIAQYSTGFIVGTQNGSIDRAIWNVKEGVVDFDSAERAMMLGSETGSLMSEDAQVELAKTIERNKQQARTPQQINDTLPSRIDLGDGYSLRLMSLIPLSTQLRLNYPSPGVLYHYFFNETDIGILDLGWDPNTYSWRPESGEGNRILAPEHRGKYLGTKAYLKLIDVFGVMSSSGILPSVTSAEVARMWHSMEASN
ncbi:MAG: hypothetical protein HQL21_09790, partial [Candidatus Omnitrophica bacterium]|nr:hypothetical protein [Candidatus Omnitrophota bacterium]